MKKTLAAMALLILFSSLAFGQEHKTPYAGQQDRALKSLTQGEIEDYLSGSGMGFAKVAELNHHPGPKHVMVFAKKLGLTKDQRRQTKRIYDEMHKEATRLGQVLVDLEMRLDRMFVEKATTEDQTRDLILEISRVRGEIRFAHLNAHLQMVKALGADQIDKYDELRGYTDGSLQHGPGRGPGH